MGRPLIGGHRFTTPERLVRSIAALSALLGFGDAPGRRIRCVAAVAFGDETGTTTSLNAIFRKVGRHGPAGDLRTANAPVPANTRNRKAKQYSTAISPPFWIGQNAFA